MLQQSYRSPTTRTVDGNTDGSRQLRQDPRPYLRVGDLQGVRHLLDLRPVQRQLRAGGPHHPPHLQQARAARDEGGEGQAGRRGRHSGHHILTLDTRYRIARYALN